MISSGLCFLNGICLPFRGPDYHRLWATQQGADQVERELDGKQLFHGEMRGLATFKDRSCDGWRES